MKHIKLFENFEQKTKIEINLSGNNPDVEYGCKAVGVGNTPREAAMFVLQAACDYLTNADYHIQIKNFDKFNSTVEDYVKDEEELEEVLKMLEVGEMKQMEIFLSPWEKGLVSFFSGHSDTVRADANIERALPEASIGGYILDSYENNLYE
jgi:hypothetical protein